MKTQPKRDPDHDALYHIAEQQAGYFTSRQAAKAGFSWERLTDYTKNGRFQRVAHGIYRLAQFPSSRLEDLFVAWLKCGPRSEMPGPPKRLGVSYKRLARELALPWSTIKEAAVAAGRFLDPVLEGSSTGKWNPTSWQWQ